MKKKTTRKSWTSKADGRVYKKTNTPTKDQSGRKQARRVMERAGRVRKGDGKDVIHKDGNPRNNKLSNLGVQSPTKNRSYKRTSTGGKKNKRA